MLGVLLRILYWILYWMRIKFSILFEHNHNAGYSLVVSLSRFSSPWMERKYSLKGKLTSYAIFTFYWKRNKCVSRDSGFADPKLLQGIRWTVLISLYSSQCNGICFFFFFKKQKQKNLPSLNPGYFRHRGILTGNNLYNLTLAFFFYSSVLNICILACLLIK